MRLGAGRLRYWAWWLTPEEEPRRYDTRFFVALQAGAAVTAHLAEAERERWLPPGQAAADLGLPMLPTRYTLRDLAAHGTVAAALAAAAGRQVEARTVPVLDGAELVMPWRERYPLPVPLPGPGGPGGHPAVTP